MLYYSLLFVQPWLFTTWQQPRTTQEVWRAEQASPIQLGGLRVAEWLAGLRVYYCCFCGACPQQVKYRWNGKEEGEAVAPAIPGGPRQVPTYCGCSYFTRPALSALEYFAEY